MINEYKTLSEILELCLSLDLTACATYHQFASECEIPSLATEWQLRSKEEKSHISFWEQALALSKQKQLPLVFENPIEIRNKLKEIQKTVHRVFSILSVSSVPDEELAIAFLLENYMLDPVFMIMFHAYRFIDESIEEDYEKHLLTFMDMSKNYHSNLASLHVKLFNETLHDLYISNKKLLKNSMYDSLTGLYNRRGFFSNVTSILSLAERKKLDIAIIMIDFDNFKEINNTLGHQAGDKALKEGASIINSILRASCISARYGGDEFIVLTDIEDIHSLQIICERIRENIDKKSKKISGIHFTISLGASIGKVSRPREASLAKIIYNADKKLLKAKKNSKNSWVV